MTPRYSWQHLRVSVALEIPIFVAVTKIDGMSEEKLQVTLDGLAWRRRRRPSCVR
jgi:GTPase